MVPDPGCTPSSRVLCTSLPSGWPFWMLPLSEQGSPHPLLCHPPSSQNTPSNGNSSCTCSSEEHIPTACCILPPSHMLFGLCPWHTPQVPGGNELACLVHNGILCTWYPACHITGADEKLSSRRNVHHKKKKKKNRSHQLLSYEAMC